MKKLQGKIDLSTIKKKMDWEDMMRKGSITFNPLDKEIRDLGYIIYQSGYKDNIASKENLIYRYYAIPSDNHRLRNTPFYYDKENDFVHYTSLESAYSIINTGCIRLYSLTNMDDKLEFEYAKQELEFPHFFENEKEQLYCLSMCSYKDVFSSETKEHLLWKLYGKNGYGVMLRLSFKNRPYQWYNFHLVKIFYDFKNVTLIKELNINNKKLIFDSKLACFFKHPIYEYENEVRLIFENRENFRVTLTDKNKNLLYPITYPDKLHTAKNIFYFQLPLINYNIGNKKIYHAPNVQGLKYEIPKIEIKEIVLGYRYTDEDLTNIRRKINQKGNIVIRLTDLKKYF